MRVRQTKIERQCINQTVNYFAGAVKVGREDWAEPWRKQVVKLKEDNRLTKKQLAIVDRYL